MSQPVNIAIIGTGIFAHRHLEAYNELPGKYNLVACSNRSREKAEKFATAANIPQDAVYIDPSVILKNPEIDALDVLVPVQYNLEMAKAAVNHGKHLVIEKPIAHTLEDARQIVELSRKAKTQIMIAENFAFNNVTAKVAQLIKSGEIGEVITFNYSAVRPYNPKSPYYATAWRQKPEHPGGYLSDGGVHNLTTIVKILGPIESVTAMANQKYAIHGAEDNLMSAVKMANGALGTITFTYCATPPGHATFAIYGTKGSIEISDKFSSMHQTSKNQFTLTNAEGQSQVVNVNEDTPQDVEGVLSNFYSVLRQGGQLGITTEEAYHHLAYFVAALESAKTGKEPVAVMEGGNGHVENGHSAEARRPKAVIVGGGIAGLMLANCFLKVGIDFVVLERAERANQAHGSNVFLVPNGSRVLQQLGLWDKILAKGTKAVANDFWEQRGDTVKLWNTVSASVAHSYENRYGYPQLSVYRKDLLIALWEQINDDFIHCGKKVTNIVDGEDKVTAVFDDGSKFSGDFIVGADGAWSHVRRSMFRNVEIEDPKLLSDGDKEGLQCQYHGIFGYSKPIEGLEVNNHFNWITGKGCMMNSIVCESEEPGAPPRVDFIFCARIDDPKNALKLQWSAADANEMSTKYRDHLTPHNNITFGQLAEGAEVLVKGQPGGEVLWFVDGSHCWTYCRTVLIGDAAHKMSPFVGQGANQAIEDAVVLTNVLVHAMSKKKLMTTKDYEEAFQTFVKHRHERAKFCVDQARQFGNLVTWRNSLWKWAGKTLLQLPALLSLPLGDKLHENMPTLKCLPAPPVNGKIKPKEHPLYY